MKKNIIIIIAFALYTFSCSNNSIAVRGFSIPTGLDKATIVPTDSVNSVIIRAEKGLESVKASDIIEEVRYIPLETTSESLIGAYTNIIVHNDRIFILDWIISESLFIFDLNGKFLKKLGQKGGGPEEFGQVSGFSISKENNYIILYDNWKRRMMYYDLNGDFLKKTDVLYRQSSYFGILPSNLVVTVTGSCDQNMHLGDFERFRLIFTDTHGQIKKFGFEFDDNKNLDVEWSYVFYYNGELLYYQQYTHSIYQVSDTVIREKYRIEAPNGLQFDIGRINDFYTKDEFDAYWNLKSNLCPYIAETPRHLYFVMNYEKKYVLFFYDKETLKSIGYKAIVLDNDFSGFQNPKLFSWEDYFIAHVTPEELSALRDRRQKEGNLFSESVSAMIDNLKEDDNEVLVLFKIKSI